MFQSNHLLQEFQEVINLWFRSHHKIQLIQDRRMKQLLVKDYYQMKY